MTTAVRRLWLGSSLLALCAAACEAGEALDPSVQPLFRAAEAPSNTNAVAVSQSRIDLSWRDNSTNETGFEVQRSTAGASGPFALRASTGASVTSYSDEGLTPSTQYCYTVRAYKTTGSRTRYSSFSSTACATTPAPPAPPGPPNAPSLANARPVSSTAILIEWRDNATNEDGFRVERSLDGGGSWVTAGTNGPALWWSPSFYDYGASEQSVCYRIFAFNVNGDSPPSNTACATPPAGPSDLVVTQVDEQTVTLTWTDNSTVEDGYLVLALLDSRGSLEASELIASLPANSTSVQAGLCAGAAYGCYGYAVAATKDGGYSDWVMVVTVPYE